METTYKPALFRTVWLTDAVKAVFFETGGIFMAIGAGVAFAFSAELEFLRWAAWLLVGFLVLAVIGYTAANAYSERVNQEVFVRNWIEASGNSEEKSLRQGLLATGGYAAALGAAGSMARDSTLMDEPMFNIDGTPMVGMLDVNGNVYGVTEDSSGAWNTDTGHFGTDDTSYLSPMNMDDPTQL